MTCSENIQKRRDGFVNDFERKRLNLTETDDKLKTVEGI